MPMFVCYPSQIQNSSEFIFFFSKMELGTLGSHDQRFELILLVLLSNNIPSHKIDGILVFPSATLACSLF